MPKIIIYVSEWMDAPTLVLQQSEMRTSGHKLAGRLSAPECWCCFVFAKLAVKIHSETDVCSIPCCTKSRNFRWCFRLPATIPRLARESRRTSRPLQRMVVLALHALLLLPCNQRAE